MSRFQKGQSLVEFAFVLPLFLAILIAIWNFGMIFMDYQALNGIARSSAREASQITDDEYSSSGYASVYATYARESLPVTIYNWNPSNRSDFNLEYLDTSQNVMVTLRATPTRDGNLLFSVIDRLLGADRVNNLFTLRIEYIMRSETNHGSDDSD